MLLSGKTGIIFGASSKYSLGFNIAKAWIAAGASHVTIACETENLCTKIQGLALKDGWWEESRCSVKQCDVSNENDLRRFDSEVDMVIHSIAFAPTNALRANSLLSYSKSDFLKTMEISAFSLLAIVSNVKFPREKGGSITSLTFDASARVIPTYGAMAPAKAALETLTRYLAFELGSKNVRVNCISPGPINTPAARAMPNFHLLHDASCRRSALGRGVKTSEVGSTAVFLASDSASGITGQIIKVDCAESSAV